MSSYSRRFALLALPAALCACGFTPVYAPGGAGTQLRGKVELDTPTNDNTYLLVRNIEERLGRATAPEYRLSVLPITVSQGQAITEEGAITRFSLVGVAEYELRRLGTNEVLAQGDVRNFTGYSATGSTVETLAAADDAQKRLMQILADQIVTALYATADLSA